MKIRKLACNFRVTIGGSYEQVTDWKETRTSYNLLISHISRYRSVAVRAWKYIHFELIQKLDQILPIASPNINFVLPEIEKRFSKIKNYWISRLWWDDFSSIQKWINRALRLVGSSTFEIAIENRHYYLYYIISNKNNNNNNDKFTLRLLHKTLEYEFSMTPVFSLYGKIRVRESPHSNINLIITITMALFIVSENVFTMSNTADIAIMKINNKKRQEKKLNLFNWDSCPLHPYRCEIYLNLLLLSIFT